MWSQCRTDVYERDEKRYSKKHPRELKAVLDNLEFYVEALQSGTHPMQIKAGFIHREPQRVIAIDQKGGGKSLAATRLYIYADVDSQILYLIALGDKGSQKSDIQTSRDFVNELLKRQAFDDQDQQEKL